MKRRDILTLLGFGTLSTTIFVAQLRQSQGESRQPSERAEVLATDPTPSLEQAEILPTEQASLTTQIRVDWTTSVAQSTPLIFGSNDYEITSPTKAQDATFQNLLEELNIPLVRIHHSKLSNRWTNAATKSWDEAKIKAGYDASYAHNPTIVQNIPRWPEWMATDEDGLLATSEHDNYAMLCAELVKIINQNQQRQVMYWEPFNELEKRYKKAGKLDQLWSIYNKAAEAMKAQDPSIKVGGPVLTWDNPKMLARFLQNCAANVDFISWHSYGTGNAEESTEKLMSRTSMYRKQVHRFRSITSKYIPDRQVPLFLSEYNLNYSWKSGEERQNSYIGAVWFASVFKHLAEVGIEMAASWHLKNNIYGMIDEENNLRPVATVFAWGNRYLTGTVAETESDNPMIESLAVNQESGKRSLLLINKSSTPAQVKLQTTPNIFSTSNVEAVSLGEKGVKDIPEAEALINSQQLVLEPYSLVLWKFSA